MKFNRKGKILYTLFILLAVFFLNFFVSVQSQMKSRDIVGIKEKLNSLVVSDITDILSRVDEDLKIECNSDCIESLIELIPSLEEIELNHPIGLRLYDIVTKNSAFNIELQISEMNQEFIAYLRVITVNGRQNRIVRLTSAELLSWAKKYRFIR